MSKQRRCFIGARFTKLTLIKLVGKKKVGKDGQAVSVWRCQCDCGNERDYTASSLCSKAKSCGCLRLKHIKELGCSNRKHPKGTAAEQNALNMMIQRCYNPQSEKDKKNYVDRKITVCDRWNPKKNNDAYRNFIYDMGRKPVGYKTMLDRIDNDKGYSPENCRWATLSESNKNRRPFKRGPNK